MILIDQLIRSRRKTISLVITPEGKLVVRAPLRLPKAQIDELINRKADWIAHHQAQVLRRTPAVPAARFANGQLFWYLGQTYALQLIDHQKAPLVFAGAFLLSRQALPQAEQVFQAWYRKQASQILAERTDLQSRRTGLVFQAVKITSARSRWGSCSPKNILSFPWRLVMAPLSVIDYVVVHELVHTVERNHQKKFWETVAILAPAFKEHKQWLKSNSPNLRII